MQQLYGRKENLCRMFFLLFLILVLNTTCVLYVGAESTDEDDSVMDFVLVLDCSGSMRASDQDNLVMNAAKMFADMLPVEDARLAVIAFGNEYGGDAGWYDLNQIEALKGDMEEKPLAQNQVKLAMDLTDITEQDQKKAAKMCIEKVLTEEIDGEKYTPIGYALETACQVLEEHETETKSAAIILMSDGRLCGQAESDSYDNGLKSYSVDRAVDMAREKGWTIYPLELNMDGLNDEGGDYKCKRAAYEMRKHIPETSGDHIVLHSATEAQSAFTRIFEAFFKAQQDPINSSSADKSYTVSIGELVAETNIILEGTDDEIESVEKVVITDPNGNEMLWGEDFEQQIIFEERYIAVKLLAPTPGEWIVTIYGAEDTELNAYAVSMHELKLMLYATANETELHKGATVYFEAQFKYHNKPYTSSYVYEKYPVMLYIEGAGGKSVYMESNGDCYGSSFQFSLTGEYHVSAYMDNEAMFRLGKRESNVCDFIIKNIAPAPEGLIKDRKIYVGEETTIDCSAYFSNDDQDVIFYDASFDETSGITKIKETSNKLKLQAGEKAGEYKIKISASDGEAEAFQIFTLYIDNHPLELADGISEGGDITVKLAYNVDNLPNLLRLFCDEKWTPEITLNWADYFVDEDNLPAVVSVSAKEKSNSIQAQQYENGEAIQFIGKEKGSAVYLATVRDRSDSSVFHTVNLFVYSENIFWLLVKQYWYILMGVAILIVMVVYGFAGYGIPGVWIINDSKQVRLDEKKEGKKKKGNLQKLFREFEVDADLSGAMIRSKTRFFKKVYISGLDMADEVVYDGHIYTKDEPVPKRFLMDVGKKIIIKRNGITVDLKRIKK